MKKNSQYLIDIIDVKNEPNILNQLRLYDVKIGQRFRFTKDGLIYIKDTEQGLNNQVSYCHTEKEIKTRGYGYPKRRNTCRKQTDIIYEILTDEIKRGGKRINAGRKKSEHKKIVLSFRVDERNARELKQRIKTLIQQTKVE